MEMTPKDVVEMVVYVVVPIFLWWLKSELSKSQARNDASLGEIRSENKVAAAQTQVALLEMKAEMGERITALGETLTKRMDDRYVSSEHCALLHAEAVAQDGRIDSVSANIGNLEGRVSKLEER